MKRTMRLVVAVTVLVLLAVIAAALIFKPKTVQLPVDAGFVRMEVMVNRYIAAMKTFHDKYGALPGDMPNATEFWATTATNGNGDGKIEGPEVASAWNMLERAGLIEEIAGAHPMFDMKAEAEKGGPKVEGDLPIILFGLYHLSYGGKTGNVLYTQYDPRSTVFFSTDVVRRTYEKGGNPVINGSGKTGCVDEQGNYIFANNNTADCAFMYWVE